MLLKSKCCKWDGWEQIRAILKEPGQEPVERYIDPRSLEMAEREGRFRRMAFSTDAAVWDEGDGRLNGYFLDWPLYGTVVVAGLAVVDGCGGKLWHLPRRLTLESIREMLNEKRE